VDYEYFREFEAKIGTARNVWVSDLCRTGLCNNPRKPASLSCPFKERSSAEDFIVASALERTWSYLNVLLKGHAEKGGERIGSVRPNGPEWRFGLSYTDVYFERLNDVWCPGGDILWGGGGGRQIKTLIKKRLCASVSQQDCRE
jgi:hypothetical protein